MITEIDFINSLTWEAIGADAALLGKRHDRNEEFEGCKLLIDAIIKGDEAKLGHLIMSYARDYFLDAVNEEDPWHGLNLPRFLALNGIFINEDESGSSSHDNSEAVLDTRDRARDIGLINMVLA